MAYKISFFLAFNIIGEECGYPLIQPQLPSEALRIIGTFLVQIYIELFYLKFCWKLKAKMSSIIRTASLKSVLNAFFEPFIVWLHVRKIYADLPSVLPMKFIRTVHCYSHFDVSGGSRVTPPHSQPWMVALVFDGPGTFLQRQFCGGALISDDKILTAAKCDVSKYVNSLPLLWLWKQKLNLCWAKVRRKLILFSFSP